MDIQGISRAIVELGELGFDRMWVALRDGNGFDVPLGEDNAALTYRDEDGSVTFRTSDKPRTPRINLEEIVAIEAPRGTAR